MAPKIAENSISCDDIRASLASAAEDLKTRFLAGESVVALVQARAAIIDQHLVELWERHLGVEAISVDDDFFALGGDSLAALEMTVRLGERLGVDLPDALLFANATPRALALAVDEHRGAGSASEVVPSAPVAGAGGDPPQLSSGE